MPESTISICSTAFRSKGGSDRHQELLEGKLSEETQLKTCSVMTRGRTRSLAGGGADVDQGGEQQQLRRFM